MAGCGSNSLDICLGSDRLARMAYLISILIGGAIVLQSGMNKAVGDRTNLIFATFWNTLVLLAITIVGLVWTAQRGTSSFRISDWSQKFEMWTIIPGFLGFVIVAGIPLVMGKIGATRVFVLLVVSQLIFSMVWDAYAQGQIPSPKQMLGVALAMASVFLVR